MLKCTNDKTLQMKTCFRKNGKYANESFVIN